MWSTRCASPLDYRRSANIDQFQAYEAQPTAKTSSNKGGRAIILVVERDPNIRDLEAYFLNEAGFAVEFATDGVAAFEQAKKIRPDIVITEVLVPKLDGLSLCRRIKSDADLSRTVVLIFSILAVQARAKDAGADAFLMKPLAEQRLVDTVRQLLGTRGPSASTGDIS
ncbi:MAG TPA: response regulator [Gemmatimonadaceae bacterium]